MSAYFPEYMKARFSAGLISQMAQVRPKIDSWSQLGTKPNVSGAITLTNVHFAYPQRPDAHVLHGMQLSVKPGQTLALVGQSGCGKSTTVSLLLRYYDPMEGELLLDNVNLSAINVEYARSVMSVVSQEPVLFDCSIEE